MPDNFVHSLCTHACHKAENLPSFCLGTAKSQLRPKLIIYFLDRSSVRIIN